MRRYVIPVAGVFLLPASGFAQEVGAADQLYAQATMAQPAMPARPATAPAATQEMKKFLVFFDWDKATLTPEARRIIATAAEDFKKTGSTRIVATGHTDTSGSAQYNMGLSIRRADAVKAELVRLGVPAASITTIGRGQEDLLVPTKDGVREPQNRRVSIEFPMPVVAKPAPAPTPVAAPPPPPPPPPPLKWAVTLGPWYGYNIKETDKGSNKQSNLVGADLGISYYATPWLPITVSQQGFNTLDTSNDDGWGGRSTLGLGYEAPTGMVKPYIGIYGGGVYGKGVQDGFVAGPELGMKVDFSRNWFMYAKAAYDFQVSRNSWDQGIPNGGLGAGYRF